VASNITWNLRNNTNRTILIPHSLHETLTESDPHSTFDLFAPEVTAPDLPAAKGMIESLAIYLLHYLELRDASMRRLAKDLNEFAISKCNSTPSHLAEYNLAMQLYNKLLEALAPDDVWTLLLFGYRDLDGLTIDHISDETVANKLTICRIRVFRELVDYSVSACGLFKAFGEIVNYRAFRGGLYTDPRSYRQFTPVT
jgi:hypothetical protein